MVDLECPLGFLGVKYPVHRRCLGIFAGDLRGRQPSVYKRGGGKGDGGRWG